MTSRIMARDLTPGDAFTGRTQAGYVISHLVTDVECSLHSVTVYSLRYHPTTAVIDDHTRVFAADALLHFVGSAGLTEGN